MRQLRIPLILPAVTVLIAAATACGSSPAVEQTTTAAAPAPTPTPTPVNVEALIQRSGEAMADLKTFRFFLSHPSGGTPLDLLPGLAIQEIEGAVINPDGLEARFAGTLGALYVESRLISVAENSYLTNPLTGKWEAIPQEISPLAFFNPRDGIASMMSQVREVTLTSDDADEYIVAGLIPAEALAPLLGKTLSGVSISVELTIDRQSHHLRKARFEGRVTSGEPDGTIRIITLSGFDEPLSIEPPALP